MGNNHKNSLNALQQILIQPNIGLDSEIRQSVVESSQHKRWPMK